MYRHLFTSFPFPGMFFPRLAILCGLFWGYAVSAKSPADSVRRVHAVHAQAWNLVYSSPDSAARLAQEVLDFAGSGCLTEQADAYFIKGLYMAFLGRFSDVHALAEDISRVAYVADQPLQGPAFLLHGIAYRHQYMPSKALEALSMSINYAIIAEDGRTLASALNEIGEVMLQQQQPAIALKYFQLAADEARGGNAARVQAQALHNIGRVYATQGDDALALNFALQGLRLRREINANADLSASYALVVRVYVLRKDFVNAEKYISFAIKHDSSYRFGPSLAELYLLKAQILDGRKHKAEAITYYERAASTAGWCGDDVTQAHCFDRLAELYKGQKEYQEQYLRLSKDLRGSLSTSLDLTSLIRADERMMRMLGMPGDQARANAGNAAAPGNGGRTTTHR